MKAKRPAKASASTPLPAKHPAALCRRWLLALLAKGRNNDFIKAASAADDLPAPCDAELDSLRGEYFPRGFKATSPKNAPLLEKLGIAALMKKTSEAEEARSVLRRPRVREVVEAGAIVGVPPVAIAETLRAHLKERVSPEAVALYTSVSCDTSAVTRSQLKVLMQERVRLSVMRAAGDDADETTTRFAIQGDARMVALSLPAAALCWDTVLLSCGFSPPRRELAVAIGQLESAAVLRANEAMLRGGRDDERRALAFVDVIQKLRQIRESVVSPERDLEKKMNAFQLRHAEGQSTTVLRLREQGGEVTVDVAPLHLGGDDFERQFGGEPGR